VIRRTDRLNAFVERQLGEKAKEIVGRTGANVVARAASFLLLADSRASFALEGERPPRGRWSAGRELSCRQEEFH